MILSLSPDTPHFSVLCTCHYFVSKLPIRYGHHFYISVVGLLFYSPLLLLQSLIVLLRLSPCIATISLSRDDLQLNTLPYTESPGNQQW